MKIKSDSGGCEYCDTSCEWWGMCPHTTPYEALSFMYGEVDNDELRRMCAEASIDEQREVIAKYYLKKRRKRGGRIWFKRLESLFDGKSQMEMF